MKLKTVAILLLILLSLLPVYMLYNYLRQAMRPRESMLRFLSWLLLVMALIFTYTFLVVLVLKLLFPGA